MVTAVVGDILGPCREAQGSSQTLASLTRRPRQPLGFVMSEKHNLLLNALFLTQVCSRLIPCSGKCLGMRDAWSNVLGELQEMRLNRPAGQVARCMGRHGKEAGGAFQMIGPLLVDGGEDNG